MTNFIILLGSMSLQAALIILLVLLCRKLFEIVHISKKYMMFLWVLPFFFLIWPWKISVPFGVWENAPTDYVLEGLVSEEDFLTGTNGQEGGWSAGIAGEQALGAQGDSEATGMSGGEAGVGMSGLLGESGMGMSGLLGGEAGNGMTGEAGNDMLGVNGYDIAEFSGDYAENAIPGYIGKGAITRITVDGRIFKICFFIWLAGVTVIMLRTLLSYRKLQESLLCSVCREGNIYVADDIQVPMVFGVIRPRIYLPSGLEESYQPYVVAHEQTHIRRKDPQMKLAAFLITSIHWFNPLVWLAYHLLGKDMEMACDEETVQRLGMDNRRAYANALLQLSAGSQGRRSFSFSTPVGFDEGDTKGRIQNILKYQKTLKIVAAVAVALGILLGISLLTKSESTISLGRVDGMYVSETFNEEVVLTYSTGSTTEFVAFTGSDGEIFGKWLSELLVEKEPISESRSEDRAKDITLKLGEELQYHFNQDMSEVWLEDSVKPTYSYRIVNPQEARVFLEEQLTKALEAEKDVSNQKGAGRQNDISGQNSPDNQDKENEVGNAASDAQGANSEGADKMSIPSETEVLALRRQVTAGMTEEEIARITENIKVANQTMEKAYFNDDIFEELSDPESLYWNYLDATGDIQIGWRLRSDSPTFDTSYHMTYDEFCETYGEPVMVYNRFDADNFIELMTKMRDSMKSELAKKDFDILIHNVYIAKENRNVECLKEAYYILHDLDYFLFRYGPSDVGMYVEDASIVSKYYGVLNAYDLWRQQYLYTDLDMDFNTTETIWTELREVDGKLMHVVRVQMENGEEAERLYTVRNQEMGDEITVEARSLNRENRNNLVVFITDSTSNYASTDIHVLHLEKTDDGITLVEDLTILDGNEQAPEYEAYKDTCLLTDLNSTCYYRGDRVFLSMVGWQSAIRIRGLQDGEEVLRFVFWDGSSWICDSFQGTPAMLGEEITADLDGDGSEDTIRYDCRFASVSSYYVDAELMINGEAYIQVVQDSLIAMDGCTSQQIEFYRIVDIDRTDAYKEILIADAGPSGDPAISFFRFTGEEVLFLGTVGILSDSEAYLIPGDGSVIAQNRVFWPENNCVEDAYFLEGDDLNKYETYTYELEIQEEHELLQDLPVYHMGDLETEATVLKAGVDTITFTRIYDDGWILLRTGDQEEYAIYLDGGDEKWMGRYLPDGRYIDEVVADMSHAG